MGFADVVSQGNTRPPQGIFEQSVDQKADLGYKFKFLDGREYVYCKAGAGITMANLVQAPVVDATNDNSMAVQAAAKADDRELKVTVASGHATFAANAYTGGFLVIEAGTRIGICRMIKSHNSHTSGTANTVTFKFRDKLGLAVAISGHTIGIIACPYNGVITNAGTAKLLGAAPIAITSAYYFWLQTRGNGPAIATAATIAVDDLVMANGANVLTRAGDAEPAVGHATAAFAASEAGTIYYEIE
jgi:hypothetical protein